MENPLKIREELMAKASPAARRQYMDGMRKYFLGLLSHRELAIIVRRALGPHTAIHNRFIRAIFTSAEDQAFREEHGAGYANAIKGKQPARDQPRPVPNPGPQGQKPPPGPPKPVVQTPKPVKTMWSVKYPALGNGPPQIQTSLAGGITDLLLDEDSFVAMHNRMLQLCLPTAVDAVSPDAAIMLMHALGAYLKATVSSCPEASMPSTGGRPPHGAHMAPPQPFLYVGGNAEQEPEWEGLETEAELHDRVAREQVASAKAKAQNGDLVACVAQRQEQRLKRKREKEQGHKPKGRRRLIEIRLDQKSEAHVAKVGEVQNSQGETTSSSAVPMEEDSQSATEKGTTDPATTAHDKATDKGNDNDNNDNSKATDRTDNVERQDERSSQVGAGTEVASRPAQVAENSTEKGKSDATSAEKQKEREEGDSANKAKADGEHQARHNGHSITNGAGMGIEPPLGFAGRSTLRLPPPQPYPPAGKLGADLEAWSAREVVPPSSTSWHTGAGHGSSSTGNPADGGTNSSTSAATSKVPAQQRGKKATAAAAAAAAAAAQQQPFVPASVPVGMDYVETEAYKLYPHVTMSDLSIARARVHRFRNAVYGTGITGGMR